MDIHSQPQKLSSALFALDPECGREEWVRALTGFKAGGGDIESAMGWSEGGGSFNPADFYSTWRSIDAEGGITEATLFGMARDAGWKPDRQGNYEFKPRPKTIQAPQSSKTQPYAIALWDGCERDDAVMASHPYALKKRISGAAGAGRSAASGRLIGREADCLIVPQRTLEGALIGVECINTNGVKQSYGKKGILVLGNDLDDTLPQLIVEGWATAVSVLNLYAWNACVYACFGKGMMTKLAIQVATKFPQRQVIIGDEQDG